MDPQEPITRLTKNNVPYRKPFLSPDESYIPIPLEVECVLRVGEGPVIPNIPFNESQIRPPLYVPRPDDDFIDGLEPHVWWEKYGNGECYGKQCDSATGLLLSWAGLSTIMTMLVTLLW